jgi:hypothetical protein
MAIAIVRSNLTSSPTWRQFQAACGCVALAILAGCGLYAIETLLLHSERRFVENPADTMTRAIGLAHFSIGWLFLFTSPKVRNRAALGRLAFWTLFGVAFCWVFAWGGADKNPLCLMAFYSFFFIHEAFDEAFLFRQSGELHDDNPHVARLLRSLGWSVSFFLMTLLAAGQITRGHFFGRSAMLHDIPAEWLVAVWFTFALLTIASFAATCRLAVAAHGSLRQTTLVYQPLLAVYGGLIAILVLGSLFGSVGANLVIMLHGMTWLVQTTRRLSERRQEVTGVWSWLRGSPVGFLTLHLCVIVLSLFLFAMRSHVWERTGMVCDLVSKTWFPYWAIMHIATAFWRGK